MRLDSDTDLFKTLIVNTSLDFNILNVYVEKDYWLVLLLKEIFAKDLDYVFKGGTSLSKCYRLINRFSEDIDISYEANYKELGQSPRERRYRGIVRSIDSVGLEIANRSDLRRGRYFNQFHCPYPSLFDSNVIKKEVVIELAAQTPSFPSNKKQIQSFIGEYLTKINRLDLVEKYGLQPFEINVQSLERTLVDKTYAICDYYLSNKCGGHSRHLYDISKILTLVSLDDNLANLYKEIYSYRYPITVCKSAKDGYKLFDLISKILDEESFKQDYESVTAVLLYEQYPYIDCYNSLTKLMLFLKENDI